MKKIIFLPILLIFLSSCSSTDDAVKILFDTDFGGDADDLGALAMLHNLMDQGECELLGIMVWSQEENVVPAIDAVNRFYKHPEIPIGVRQGGSYSDSSNYSIPIAARFPYELSYDLVPDVTELYRKILSENMDHSVSIVTVGPLMNIEKLINSEGDRYSPLSGRQLINKKVKEFVVMGGQFPEGENEWNFNGNMPGVTRFVLDNLEVPIIFSGFELGVQIRTAAILNTTDPQTPLYVGYKYFSEHAPWIRARYSGSILDNASYDQTAVLYAVRKGDGKYWKRIEGGRCVADDHGGNRWIEDNASNHSYLELIQDASAMGHLIDSIMQNQF